MIEARTCSGLFLLHLDMLKVGITGGIGAGKSIVCKIFEILGIPVYYADEAAKELMQQNEELVSEIKKHFSADAYREDRQLTNMAFFCPRVLKEF